VNKTRLGEMSFLSVAVHVFQKFGLRPSNPNNSAQYRYATPSKKQKKKRRGISFSLPSRNLDTISYLTDFS
jgi:hypothetical protein